MTPNPKHERQHMNENPDDDEEEDHHHLIDRHHHHHPTKRQQQEPERPIQYYIPSHLRPYVKPYRGDFCYTPVFHPTLLCQLMREGFLPIACTQYLLPKLHYQRCIIQPLSDQHISKSARKKAKQYCMTFNTSFDAVVEGCRRQHGPNCWLYPALVQAFRQIHTNNGGGTNNPTKNKNSSATNGNGIVRLYSVEVWNVMDQTLAAGELGYTVGSIYTSLTGFTDQDSAGSVQMAVLGHVLQLNQYTMWDLGMEMKYKTNLGSHLIQRHDFVQQVHSVRNRDLPLQLVCSSNNTSMEPKDGTMKTEPFTNNCRDILQATSLCLEDISQSIATTTTTAPATTTITTTTSTTS